MRARTKTIEPDVLDVLKNVEIDGNNVRITQQLDRKLYKKTNDALEALGGKWNRKAKAHVFAEDPRQAIAAAVGGGTYESVKDAEKEAGYFPTPVELAKKVVDLADIRPGDRVLEPSAGQGRIADEVRKEHPDADLYLCELLEGNIDALIAKGYPRGRICPDFLRFQPVKKFDRIVMNPPFAKQADLEHVTRAYEMLAPGGKLVSIMSPSFQYRNDKKSKAFRGLINSVQGIVFDNPPGSFKEAGTDVNTVTVILTKERTEAVPASKLKKGDEVVDSDGTKGVVWKTPSEDDFDRYSWTYRVYVMDPKTRRKQWRMESNLSLAPSTERKSSRRSKAKETQPKTEPPLMNESVHPELLAQYRTVMRRSAAAKNLPVRGRRNLIGMLRDPLIAGVMLAPTEAERAKKLELLKSIRALDVHALQQMFWRGLDQWDYAKRPLGSTNILAPDAFAKLTELEGKAWAADERKHADQPGRFLDAQDAYRILQDSGLTQTHTLADVADSPGFVGANDEIYVVLRDGEIALLEDTATPEKVAEAERVVRVIIPEDPDPFETAATKAPKPASARKSSKKAQPKGKGLDPKFQAALDRYVATVQQIINDDFARNYPNLTPPEIRYEKLRKYVRVYRFENGRAASVHSFVDPATGDIYKSASWKTPAKHARGNVYRDPTEALGARGGVVYMR